MQVARDMESKNRRKRNRGRSGPAIRNGTGGLPSDPGLCAGSAYSITVMMLATSNEMEDNLIEDGMDGISSWVDCIVLYRIWHTMNSAAFHSSCPTLGQAISRKTNEGGWSLLY